MAGISLVPARLRDPVLGAVGKLAGKLAKGARRRARINLLYCLPELPESEREHIIDQMFACAPQSMVLMAELACTKPEKCSSACVGTVKRCWTRSGRKGATSFSWCHTAGRWMCRRCCARPTDGRDVPQSA